MAEDARRMTGHHHVWMEDAKTEESRCGCGARVTEEQRRAANYAYLNRFSSKQSLAGWEAAMDAFARYNAQQRGEP